MMNRIVQKPLCLVLRGDAWEHAIRQLLFAPDAWAHGDVYWNEIARLRYALVDNLTVHAGAPSGQSQPPLSDWVVVRLEPSERRLTDIVRTLNPSASQNLVLFLLDRHDRRRWRAALCRQGLIEPIDMVEIVGGGMLRLEEQSLDQNSVAVPRWSRTVARSVKMFGKR